MITLKLAGIAALVGGTIGSHHMMTKSMKTATIGEVPRVTLGWATISVVCAVSAARLTGNLITDIAFGIEPMPVVEE
jgi:hypothetical protein